MIPWTDSFELLASCPASANEKRAGGAEMFVMADVRRSSTASSADSEVELLRLKREILREEEPAFAARMRLDL